MLGECFSRGADHNPMAVFMQRIQVCCRFAI